MNIVSILSSIDTKRVPTDALPDGVDRVTFEQRVLCAIAREFTPSLHVRVDGPSAQVSPAERLVQAYQHKPTEAAVEAVRETAPHRTAKEAVEVPADVVEKVEPMDWAAAAESLIETIGQATSLGEAQRIQAETKGRVDRLNREAPKEGARVWSAMIATVKRFTEEETHGKSAPDLGRPVIEATIRNTEAFFKRPQKEWEAVACGRSSEEIAELLLNNPQTAERVASARAHHPDLHSRLMEIIKRGRVEA